MPSILNSQRLTMRPWHASDLDNFILLNLDSDVMAFFPKVLKEEESRMLADNVQAHFDRRGWGIWVVEKKESGEWIGCVGLQDARDDLPFSPCVEVVWRLAKSHWGCGYATEAAQEALRFAFQDVGLHEVVAFTVKNNYRSIAVMERIGLVNTGRNFNHPSLTKGHLLSEHVLYSISDEQWLNRNVKI